LTFSATTAGDCLCGPYSYVVMVSTHNGWQPHRRQA